MEQAKNEVLNKIKGTHDMIHTMTLKKFRLKAGTREVAVGMVVVLKDCIVQVVEKTNSDVVIAVWFN